MSKYITHFQTEAAYQTALPTLNLPNVSLVDELGEVHYHRALYGAHAGDICLYDVAEAQKIVVNPSNWNLTTYPTANYPIIGVVVADETTLGCILRSVGYLKADGSTGYDVWSGNLKWQNTSFDWGLTKYNTADLAKTDFNGKTNTATIIAAIKAYDLSHGTDNLTGNIGQAIQLYSRTGTNPGDWYIPSEGELNLMYTNKTILQNTFSTIRQKSISLAAEFDSNSHNTSTEKDTNNYWQSNINNTNAISKQTTYQPIPFTKL